MHLSAQPSMWLPSEALTCFLCACMVCAGGKRSPARHGSVLRWNTPRTVVKETESGAAVPLSQNTGDTPLFLPVASK